MRLKFMGNSTFQKVFNYSIQGNNASETIEFVLTALQEDIDLRKCRAFVKSSTTSRSFVDKQTVEIEDLGNDEILVKWTILRKHSQHRSLNVQLVFEGTTLDTVWQTAVIVFNFGKTIEADEEIANQEPSIIQDFEKRITALEGQTTHAVQEYDSFIDFPTVGMVGQLYIDEETNSCYRWDDNELKYFCVGTDYTQIEIINGGIL